MRIFIDDGSTNVKMVWKEGDKLHNHLSPNSFRTGWSPAFQGSVYNYVIDNEKYTFDPISPETLGTHSASWQYSAENALAIHHALLTSKLEPQEIEVVVTLPLAEFYDSDGQPRMDNINRKKQSVMRPVELKNGETFSFSKVTVRPESIPAGIDLAEQLKEGQSMLIIDLGGTTLDLAVASHKLLGLSRVCGYPNIGVSIVIDAAVDAVRAVDETAFSRLNAARLVIHRDDLDFIGDHIINTDRAAEVQNRINDGIATLTARVLREVDKLTGYTHILLVGGGAPLIAEALQKHTGLSDSRFFVPDNAQLALAYGLEQLG